MKTNTGDITIEKTNTEIINTTTDISGWLNESLWNYLDKELWISFSYPKSRWEIEKEYDTPGNEGIGLAILSIWWNVAFAFGNWKPSLWRWAFWWDEAKEIKDENKINKLCDWKNEPCNINKNKNGITYVKESRKYKEMGEENWKSMTIYTLFNPDSQFPWIVISNERFNNLNEKEFDAMVDSIEFIK